MYLTLSDQPLFTRTFLKQSPSLTSPRYVAFPTSGDALFAIWTGAEKPDATAPRYSEIGIMLPTHADVDALYREWQHNAEIRVIKEPYDEVFGRTFLVQDPDGHVIRVCPFD